MADLTFLSLHPFVKSTVVDKVRGTIFGSALGDAIGLYTEFLSKDLSTHAYGAYPEARFQLTTPTTEFYPDGHRNKFTPRSWTDDTDHALLIILSFLHSNGTVISPRDFAARLKIWVEQGLRCLDRLPLGLGATVGRVVCDKNYSENPELVAYKVWSSRGHNIAPNGSLMRAHPLGVICIGKSLEETFQIAIDFSVVTHADPRCVVACCVHTGLIRGILRGEDTSEDDIDRILEAAFTFVAKWQQNGRSFDKAQNGSGKFPADVLLAEPALDRIEFDKYVNASSFEELQLDSAREIGYVYKALGGCILCLRLAIRHSNSQHTDEQYTQPGTNIFEELITALIMQGGDADTNACIAGAVLGAWIGNSGLPPTWRDGLDHNRWLLHKCRAMEQVLGIDESLTGYDGVQDKDTLSDGGRGLLDKRSLEARDAAFVDMYTKKMKMMAERMAHKERKETDRGWMRGLLK
ncbi:hypothetical protein PISL3812_06164 [Talaromyces islandicus]|uniref:ADP-ribosylglycohydrolase n=1 Tax=Talaromyces islandicus TaxID=28573 RepID=A0A0U1M0M5_TALIS|nr:hypothetical protein PISL3812_06164 [Talaromyces islandicus]